MGLKPRAVDRAERVQVRSRQDWRSWLRENHGQTTGIWLITFKKHHDSYLPWHDLVQEALCFGWIDGLARKLDADRTMRYLSPRKAGSLWSGLNKRHVAELEARGLMQPAGRSKIEAAKRDGSWTLLDDVEALIVPDDLGRALDSAPPARARYESFTDSAKRWLLWWIKSARTDSTRADRIAKAVSAAKLGRVANQPG